MKNFDILWVDDEIDLLKSHLLFLEERNYIVTTCNSGQDALEEIRNNTFDIVFLDENMPGLSGLETLTELKQIEPSLPVVMITKNEFPKKQQLIISKNSGKLRWIFRWLIRTKNGPIYTESLFSGSCN